MSSVLGSAVALAGAYVAISLAKHALELQEGQQGREHVQSHFQILEVISKYLAQATLPIVEIIFGIQTINATATLIDTLLYSFNSKYLRATDSPDAITLSNNLSSEMISDIEEIRSLHTSLLQNSFLNLATMRRDNSAVKNSISAFLVSKIYCKRFQFLQGDVEVTFADMALWATIFQKNADALRKLNSYESPQYFREIFQSFLITHSCMVDRNGKKFNHAGLKCFLLIDN